MRQFRFAVRALVLAPAAAAAILLGVSGSVLGTCGPFTDVAADAFCPFVLEIFYMGITTGTTPTTYDPGANVTRLQMAAFLGRSVDRIFDRATRRASLKRFWTTQNAQILAVTTVGGNAGFADSDGTDVWVGIGNLGQVTRVQGSNGRILETWTGASSAHGVAAAAGLVFVAGSTGLSTPGMLYRINPSQPAGAVTTVASNLGANPQQITFDGGRIWTANYATGSGGGSVSIVTPGATIPWSSTTVSVGFGNPVGILFDGSNVWTTDVTAGTLLKLDGGGAILQTVTVGAVPFQPAFDGVNIWVPNYGGNTVTVVRASSGAILTTLTANGMNGPNFAAFDGERILVTNAGASVVSLWKAADLTAIGNFPIGAAASSACSDGLSFWLVFPVPGQLARF